jgi:hypothetical protein
VICPCLAPYDYGLVRIRNFGFLANRRRAALLPLRFHLLGSAQHLQAEQNRSSAKDSPDLRHTRSALPDEGHRAAYRCRTPTPLATRGHRGSMNPLSPIRILRVPRRGSHFFALSSNNSLLPASTPYFFARTRFRTPGLTRCNSVLACSEPPRRSFPSLNFHRARHVQTAQENRAIEVLAVLTRQQIRLC